MHARTISRRRFIGLSAAGALGVLTGCGTEQAERGTRVTPYDERFRPQFHFSPESNWMNDPNGLVYHDGQYHLFFQYNPRGSTWGHISWGHAVSDDLVDWEQLPVALKPDEMGLIWSGGAVVDGDDTSGFFDGGSGLVAFYTSAGGQDYENQRQSLAFSGDGGETWKKYADNPIVPNPGIKDFRDPKVIWHEKSRKWVMLLAADDRILFYGSEDLKAWTRLGEFGSDQGAHGGVWETPDLFELPVDGDPDNKRWVLTAGINPGSVEGGSGEQYFVGDFDGEGFSNHNPPEVVLWADYGKDFYAAQAWSNAPSEGGRRLWIAWMNNWQYAETIPTSPWRSAMSVPRTVALAGVPGEGTRLVQAPVDGLQRLRERSWNLRGVTVTSGRNALPQDLSGGALGETFELVARFEPGTAKELGFEVRKKGDRRTVVGYDPGSASLFVDRSRSGAVGFGNHFAGKHQAPLRRHEEVEMHLLVDRSSVEVFGGGGTAVITDQIFPPPDASGLSVYSKGGTARLASLDAYRLGSIWT